MLENLLAMQSVPCFTTAIVYNTQGPSSVHGWFLFYILAAWMQSLLRFGEQLLGSLLC